MYPSLARNCPFPIWEYMAKMIKMRSGYQQNALDLLKKWGYPSLSELACNGCSYLGVGLQLIEKHMRGAPIDNMHTGHVGQGIQTGRDFRDHPTINDSVPSLLR